MLKKPTSRIVGAASKTKNTNAERKPQAAPGVAVSSPPFPTLLSRVQWKIYGRLYQISQNNNAIA